MKRVSIPIMILVLGLAFSIHLGPATPTGSNWAITGGTPGACTWSVGLVNTNQPYSTAQVNGLSVAIGDNVLGTPGEDMGTFLNAISTPGQTYCFTPQTFTFSSTPFKISAPSAFGRGFSSLIGSSAGATVFITSSGTADILNMTWPLASLQNTQGDLGGFTTITQITFDSSVTRTGGYAVDCLCADLVVSYDNFQNQWNGVGIQPTSVGYGGDFIFVEHDIFDNWRNDGVDYFGGASLRVEHSEFIAQTVTSNAAIKLAPIFNGAGGFYFNDNDFSAVINFGPLYDLQVDSTNGFVYAILSEGNFYDRNRSNALRINAVTNSVHDIQFIHDWFCCSVNDGAILTGSAAIDTVKFSSDSFLDNNQNGLNVATSTATNIVVGDSQFYGNSHSPSNMYSGVNIAAGVTHFTVENSIAAQQSIFGNTQQWGIIVQTGGSDYYNIIGNIVTPNLTGGVSDGGAGTHKTITGNN